MKILVLADIHGNATALNAVLQKERDFDSVIFLGDAVSPGPQPVETFELLSELTGIFIRGNHEDVMLDPDLIISWPDGFKSLMDWIYRSFDAAGYQFLRGFQPEGEFTIDGQQLVLAHGNETDSVRHVLPNSNDELFEPLACGSERSTILFGHSHVQYHRCIGDQKFINPGSIGQNRCGHITACYGLITDGKFVHHHVDYDPAPFLDAVDRIGPLKEFAAFRKWFKQQVLTGFSNGKIAPWTDFAVQGYR